MIAALLTRRYLRLWCLQAAGSRGHRSLRLLGHCLWDRYWQVSCRGQARRI